MSLIYEIDDCCDEAIVESIFDRSMVVYQNHITEHMAGWGKS